MDERFPGSEYNLSPCTSPDMDRHLRREVRPLTISGRHMPSVPVRLGGRFTLRVYVVEIHLDRAVLFLDIRITNCLQVVHRSVLMSPIKAISNGVISCDISILELSQNCISSGVGNSWPRLSL